MVRRTLKLTLSGNLAAGVVARNLGAHIGSLVSKRQLPFDLDYRIFEFAGAHDQFNLAERVGLCSAPTELDAYGVFFPPSAEIMLQARSVAQQACTKTSPSLRSFWLDGALTKGCA